LTPFADISSETCASWRTTASEACFDGHSVINLSSTISRVEHPPSIGGRSEQATEAFRVGSGAVRTIAGTMQIHMELEEAIARFKHVGQCFSVGIHGQCRHGFFHPAQGRSDYLRRVEPRQHHRWLSVVAS
jgi:hypothetical protein